VTDSFMHDGFRLAYVDNGPRTAPAVLLIHGFASNKTVNWIQPGWVHTLNEAGYRTIAIDNRGHGESDKPHDSDHYAPHMLAGDSAALLDHLGIGSAHVFGYSMGARISAYLALGHAQKVKSLVFGGLGIGMVEGVGEWDPIAQALLSDTPETITHARGHMFRAFADQTGSDRFALAACIRTSRALLDRVQIRSITVPTLIGVGTRDDIAGDPHELAALMENAQAFDIERRDHMVAVGDRTFKAAVVDFYQGLN